MSHSLNLQLISNFYLHHQKLGDEYFNDHRFDEAKAAYARSLRLNPVNFILIARLAKQFQSAPELNVFNELLADVVPNALRFQGHNESVFHLASAASILQKRIMCSEMACKTNSPFKLLQPYGLGANSNSPLRSSRHRLALLTCVWQRPELTEIVLDYYQNLQARLADQIDLVMVAVGSEGATSRRLCEARGFDYHEFPNKPLTAKWEHGLQRCREHQPDGVIIVGSDDLLCEKLFRRYVDLLNQGALFVGLTDGIIIDLTKPEESILWRGYGGRISNLGQPDRLNETIGMGRLLARPLLEYLDYSLWAGHFVDSGLDRIMKNKLISIGMRPVLYEHHVPVCYEGEHYLFGQLALSMKESDFVAVDIKLPNNNITPLEKYKTCPESFEKLSNPWDLLGQSFPAKTIDRLKLITYKLNQIQ